MNEKIIRALELIEGYSTGWKLGTEGHLLLKINDISKIFVCGHAPIILHRTGGESANLKNICGKCGRYICCMDQIWVIDFEKEEN